MTDNGISILIPTRGRPSNMERVVTSAYSLAKHKDRLQFVFYIDNDDEASHKKAIELMEKYPVDFVIGERIVLSQMWNEAYKLAKYDILQHSGDDIEFLTSDWDIKVYEGFDVFKDRIVLVGGNDGSGPNVHDKKFFTHGFVHRNWIQATDNKLFHSMYSSDYNDSAINEIARNLNRWHWVDILTEHHHPNFGKAELDQTHKDRIERHYRDNVAQLYDNDKPVRDRLTQQLQQYIDTMKEIL